MTVDPLPLPPLPPPPPSPLSLVPFPSFPFLTPPPPRPPRSKLEGVKTEFVYADGANDDVQLSGDWNDWKAIQMFCECAGMWSVVTPVPPGPHEFKFIVDGEWKHSNRHPTIGIDDNSLNNVRYVLPEPDLGADRGGGGGGAGVASASASSSLPQQRLSRRDSRSSAASSQMSMPKKARSGRSLFGRK